MALCFSQSSLCGSQAFHILKLQNVLLQDHLSGSRYSVSLPSKQAKAFPWDPQCVKPMYRGRIEFLPIGRTPKLCKVMASALTPSIVQPSVQVASTLFTLGTALVVPFYTVMIFVPHMKWTRKIVESNVPYVILGAMYLYLLYLSWSPDTLQLMFASKYWLPELPGITKMFSSTLTVASAWIHLLAVDLYAGRQIFLDGLENAFETRHSLILCLLFCPIGILCHSVTKVALQIWRKAEELPDVAPYYS